MKNVTLLYERNCVMKKIISFALVCVMLVGAMLTLSSCGKSYEIPAEAKEILEEEGYTVTTEEAPNDCKTYIHAYYNNVNEKTFDEIEIFYYENEAEAEAAWTATKEPLFKAKVAEQDKDYKYEYGLDGALIYYGTKGAVKAAK